MYGFAYAKKKMANEGLNFGGKWYFGDEHSSFFSGISLLSLNLYTIHYYLYLFFWQQKIKKAERMIRSALLLICKMILAQERKFILLFY